ncbi:MAG: elongation factor Ts [Gammaproteobacteria bacterium]|nr:elongation factor Ts [Gammaproteobacteria bacterium]NIR84153.1 elongation factor Ts [Gammaproteobacteria bacterium]NIR89465.1 elongation factor Ts [Gammaproteobacteria bacterium]NIU05308.1 elongation factor Ts [Gammaproteobacteria bacterium]NIV52248.1 elongation factor Ts [Gammaproteobacteria bacterium]
MQISAGLVKELRERTGAGMMDCKKALVEAGGDLEAAVDLMRKSGQAKADRKAGRVAAEGLIGLALDGSGRVGVMVEVNCETDFVAREDTFRSFTAAVAERALEAGVTDVDALLETAMEGGGGEIIETRRRDLVAKVGENIAVRRLARMEAKGGPLGAYVHGGGRIGVLVALEGGDEELARDLAMHIAWSRPICVSEEQVPQELLRKEREILKAQAEGSGKPPAIAEKMVDGRVKKFLREITLLGQPFVKNTEVKVGQHVKEAGASVMAFERFEVGEGADKQGE